MFAKLLSYLAKDEFFLAVAILLMILSISAASPYKLTSLMVLGLFAGLLWWLNSFEDKTTTGFCNTVS